jgi:hypothetical protein
VIASPPATLLVRLLVAAAFALALAPAGAHAASVALENRSGGLEELVYRAAPGESNLLGAEYNSFDRAWRVTDPAGITAGRGCALPDAANRGLAVCTVADTSRGSGIADIQLGDRDDWARISGTGLVRAVVSGGPGNDLLVGGPEDDVFQQGRHADGADRIYGGLGNDLVDYSARRRPIRADLRGDGGDGQRGENDTIGSDVEGIVGGHGADTLRGNSGENLLVGGPGPDRLSGGPGYDVLIGGPGDDSIQARDGSIDAVTCGPGDDRVRLDGLDFFTGHCEHVQRNRAGGATVIYVSYDDTGRLLVDVGCPEDTPVPFCIGHLALTVDGRRVGREPVDLARGTRGLVTFGLPAGAAERLRAGGRITAGTVLSSRMGRIHRKVTVRWSLPLRG